MIEMDKKYNSRGNWWYEGAVCEHDGCDHSLDLPEHHEYPNHTSDCRVKLCSEHYYERVRKRTSLRRIHPDTGTNMRDWINSKAQGHYKALYGSSCRDRKADPKWRECHDKAKADAKAIDWVYPDKIVSNVIDFSTPTQFTNSFDEEVVVTKGRKRDQRVVNHVKKMYSQCAVDGCDYPLFDVAHIHALKHGADDLPGNCIPLCPNHHRDLDRGRLLLADPSDRSASDPIEFLMNGEVGQIILGGGHEVDNQYINGCIYEIASWSANAKPIT